MRKIVGGFAVSLDGFFEGPAGETDWIIMDKDMKLSEHMKRFDSFFMGRKSYEQLVKTGNEKSFPKIRNYVFSNTLTDVVDPYNLISGDIKERINQIKNLPGKDIAVYGGADLLTSLFNLDLVDEVILSVMPVIFGSGKRFLSDIKNRILLTHTDTKRFRSGLVILTYSVKLN